MCTVEHTQQTATGHSGGVEEAWLEHSVDSLLISKMGQAIVPALGLLGRVKISTEV
jgi:hypothetical protein